jgi:hypothetical protein
MHGHGRHQREDEPQRVEGVVARRHDATQADGDERGGEERETGGEEDGPQPTEPGARPQLVEVVAPQGDAPLGVFEERGVGLVPSARPAHGHAQSVARGGGRPPQVHVAALVVADPGLGADVAEGELHVLPLGGTEVLVERAEVDDGGARRPREVDGDVHRIAVGSHIGQHGVGIRPGPVDGVGDVELGHQDTPANS